MKKIALIISLFTCAFLNAQDNFEGVIVKTMTYDNMSPEMKAYAAMMPTETTVYMDKNLSKSVTQTAMGEKIILADSETGDVISLINNAGNMIGIRSNTEEEIEDQEVPEIEYLDETKEILGYTCKKAIASSDEAEVIIFYTDELPELESAKKRITDIDGFVMELIVDTEQVTVTTTVSEIREEKVKKIKMEIPSEYKEMTMEEIKALQQGDGGM